MQTLAQAQRKCLHVRQDSKFFDAASAVLKEAEEIAESDSGTMELYRVDCLIERAWLFLEVGKRDEARQRRDAASQAITRLQYGRRLPDIQRLNAQLEN